MICSPSSEFFVIVYSGFLPDCSHYNLCPAFWQRPVFLRMSSPMFMQVKVFLFCRHSAADMALGFIDIQNPPHLRGQRGIDFPQALHTVFVNGAFTHAKLFCRLAHGCVGCYDIICDLDGSLLNIILQENPPIVVFLQCMRGDGRCMY